MTHETEETCDCVICQAMDAMPEKLTGVEVLNIITHILLAYRIPPELFLASVVQIAGYVMDQANEEVSRDRDLRATH